MSPQERKILSAVKEAIASGIESELFAKREAAMREATTRELSREVALLKRKLKNATEQADSWRYQARKYKAALLERRS